MKPYIFLVVALLCAGLPSFTFAEDLKDSDANIVGHVLEKHTKEHLSYITVALKGTTIATLTDPTGHYFLKNLPEGEFEMQVSSVGYKTVTRRVVLKKGVTLEENFELEEDLVALDGVVVTANRNETLQALRADQLHHPGAGTELPAGRPRGEQLPELRLPAGTHQRPGRALHADTDRLAPGVQRTGGGVWPGADSRQHD